MINQGDVYWLELEPSIGSEPGYRRPHVVIQNNVFNQSKLQTVIVCALTSNLLLGDAPGNVLLKPREGNLPKTSVVNVSQVTTVDKSQLVEYIGKLSPRRVRQILDGIRLLTEPRDLR